MTSNNKVPNRLANEKSPYLLQHAYNPVNWFPWSEEAFAKSKSENKPIFLSIGYSTCHFCHVMERESFEDDKVAAVLNKDFVSIKVDREERPDIDSIYMNVCQTMTGSGGWPLTIFMTPEKIPFYAATYIPNNSKYGLPGIIEVLNFIADAWKNKKDELISSGNKILDLLNGKKRDTASAEINSNLTQTAFSQFGSDFDDVYGGFGSAPKFPTPHNLLFLLRYWYKTKDESALAMVEKTLDSMYKGGIYDHVGFGFSRYSTDRKWLVPHFEKMLYDNALIAIAYLETYQVTKNEQYSQVAEEIFEYILRDMTSPEGGFFSAEDADSEGEEGKFYVWTPTEIISVLGKEDGKKYCSHFNITPAGNFEGENIPNLINSDTSNLSPKFIKNCRDKLFAIRDKRVHPFKDDKILTSWNGLMIAAMAIGGRVLAKNKYIDVAQKAANFVFDNLISEDGRLLARYRDGEAAILGYVDDYAFFIWGLIELYEATFNPLYLQKALELNKELIKYFWDDEEGGLFLYGSDSEQLILRQKDIYDGATPSGNSVSAMNFLRLARLTGMFELEDKAKHLLQAFSSEMNIYPRAYSYSLIALLALESTSSEIVIVADERNDESQRMIDVINDEFRPFTSTVFYSKENQNIANLVPFISEYTTVNGNPSAGNPVFLTKNGRGRYAIMDIEEYEKIQAKIHLLCELSKGEKSGGEMGWLKIEDVERSLEVENG